MNFLTIGALELYAIVLTTLIVNVFDLLKKAKELELAGKTPLVKVNLITIILAGLGETVTVLFFYYLAGLVPISHNDLFLNVIVFILTYGLRNVSAYLIAWAVFTAHVRREQKQMKKKIDEDREKTL